LELGVRVLTPNGTLNGYGFPLYSARPEFKFWPGDVPAITSSVYQVIFEDSTSN